MPAWRLPKLRCLCPKWHSLVQEHASGG
ncbi:hypothetical protein ACBP89_22795 [Aneurinibacillus aneurinilyticus]